MIIITIIESSLHHVTLILPLTRPRKQADLSQTVTLEYYSTPAASDRAVGPRMMLVAA